MVKRRELRELRFAGFPSAGGGREKLWIVVTQIPERRPPPEGRTWSSRETPLRVGRQRRERLEGTRIVVVAVERRGSMLAGGRASDVDSERDLHRRK